MWQAPVSNSTTPSATLQLSYSRHGSVRPDHLLHAYGIFASLHVPLNNFLTYTFARQYSPYCHRVHIALEEVQADYKAVTINVMEWPQWYNTKVNPITRKVQRLSPFGPTDHSQRLVRSPQSPMVDPRPRPRILRPRQ